MLGYNLGCASKCLGNHLWGPCSTFADGHLGSGPGSMKCVPGIPCRGIPGPHIYKHGAGTPSPSLQTHDSRIPCRGIARAHLVHQKCTDLPCDKAAKPVTRSCCAALCSHLWCNKKQGHLDTCVLSPHEKHYGGTITNSVAQIKQQHSNACSHPPPQWAP